MIASSPSHRKGPYSAYEMKTILTTLVDNQEEFNGNRNKVYRKVSEALSENVFGRTPLQIQMLYWDLKKLYINQRRFRVIVKESPCFSPQEVEELKAIMEENNMLSIASLLESPELLKHLATIFNFEKNHN